MTYRILDTQSVKTFLLDIPEIKNYFDSEELQADEIGDGNVNFVFIVKSKTDPKKALIVKQAVPYLRCAGESFPLSRERMTFEIRALQEYEKLAPDYVPKIYYADEEMSIVVMEYLSDHIIMRKGLIEGTTYPLFSEHISDFLAKTLFFTSSLHLQSTEKRALINRFNANTQLCKLTEDFVFTFPYMSHETNHIDKQCEKEAKALFHDQSYKKNLLTLKYIFMTQTDALLHGDLHTGSIMLNQTETYVIDPEFAFVGPFGFDIGALIANLINAYISHEHTDRNRAFQDWILQTIEEIYTKFEMKFLDLWKRQQESALILPGFTDDATTEAFQKEFMQNIFTQSVGFAGCKIARRVFGIAGVEEIRGIEDDRTRKEASMHALRTGIGLIKSYREIKTVQQLCNYIKESS